MSGGSRPNPEQKPRYLLIIGRLSNRAKATLCRIVEAARVASVNLNTPDNTSLLVFLFVHKVEHLLW